MLLSGPALAIAGAPPPAGPLYLVIAPPWASLEAVAAGAGARRVGPFDAAWGGLVAADAPDVPTALRAAGAWAVLDGSRIAAICGVGA